MAQYLLFRRKVLNHRKDIDEIDITIMYYISEKNKQNLEMTKQLYPPALSSRGKSGPKIDALEPSKQSTTNQDPNTKFPDPHHEDLRTKIMVIFEQQ